MPVLRWLIELRDPRARAGLHARIELLENQGYTLGRPAAAPLRERLYELRARSGTVQYRILYCFHDRKAILLHGITKEGEVPEQDIKVALARRQKLFRDPGQHVYNPPGEDSDVEEEQHGV